MLAVEPQDYMADRFTKRHADRLNAGTVSLARCAVSDHAGEGDLIIGSASTVSTLEPSWTSVAFPEEFRSRRTLRVPILPLADILRQHDFGAVGFAKIDVEGHEAPALRGLFRPGIAAPPVVMFEANQRFANQALECLKILRSQGYRTFDIFIRIGADPVAAERFSEPSCPPSGMRVVNDIFTPISSVIPPIAARPSIAPARSDSVRSGLSDASRPRVASAMACAAGYRNPQNRTIQLCIRVWHAARLRLREYLQEQDWHDFLRNPICKEMFVRGRWGAGQDFEFAAVQENSFGKSLLERLRDPDVGSPRCCEKLPGVSTNLLGMIWYLTGVHQQNSGTLPPRVVEVGGGYGALAYAYAKSSPDAEYVIVDLPEMLAIQHYFLTLALPDRPIVFANEPGKVEPKPGEITLVPISRFEESELTCEQLISTFAMSEMPRELQRRIERTGYFGARRIFVTGQLSTEFPDMDLVGHGEVVGAAMHHFPRLQVERFHVGDNYLMLGERNGDPVPSPSYSGERVRVRGNSEGRATHENRPSSQPSPLITGEKGQGNLEEWPHDHDINRSRKTGRRQNQRAQSDRLAGSHTGKNSGGGTRS